MRIAFSGTSSTGKTTTANLLKERGLLDKLGLQLLRNKDSRSKLSKKVDELTLDEKLTFQNSCFMDKKIFESNQDNYIVERSFVDLLAYRSFISPIPTNEEINAHIILAKQYDLHFFFPYGIISYESDGFRPTDEYSKKVSEKIFEILNSNDIYYITLNSSSLDDRCKIIITRFLN